MNKDGLVFAGQRVGQNAYLQMPQGGIDPGEEPFEAALRELKEETGVTQIRMLYESPGWLTYDVPHELSQKLWGGLYKGQRQKWFLMQFLGRDKDICLDATDPPEFKNWQWISLNELALRVIPFKKKLYQDIIDIFGDYLA